LGLFGVARTFVFQEPPGSTTSEGAKHEGEDRESTARPVRRGRASSGADSETTGAVGDVMAALLREIAAGLAAGEAGDDKDHG
jgi:hypothetical protein